MAQPLPGFLQLQKRFLPFLNQIFSYTIEFNHRLRQLSEGIVDSSEFTLPNSSKKLKLADDGNGNIYSYYLSGTEKIKINDFHGNINYEKGTIRLVNFSPVSLNGNELKINVLPYYKDVYPIQNQIILISDTSILISSAKNRKILTKSTVETIGNLTTQYEQPIGTDIIV